MNGIEIITNRHEYVTKKIVALADYITAQHAAHILSLKLGRPIRVDYIHKIPGIRSVKLNATSTLYHKADIEAAYVRQKQKV